MGNFDDAKKKAQEARLLANTGRDKFLAEIKGIGEKLQKQIKNELLDKLDTKGGKIDKDSKANKKLIAELNKKLKNYIDKVGYNKSVADLLQSFDRITLNTAAAAEAANKIQINKNLLTKVQELSYNQAISDLIGDGFNANVVNPIAGIINKQIVLGGDLQTLIGEIEAVLVTNSTSAQTLGLLESYATRIGRDTLFQLQGSVNQAIQQEYDLDGFLYVGTEVEDTRPQCQRWLDKEFIPIDELPKELEWAYNNGTGMIKGTTPDTFAIERGGYNCRHAALPMRKSVYENSKTE